MFFDVFEPFQSTTSLGIAHAALLMVFRTRDEIETFLKFNFDVNLEDISSPSDTRPKILERVILDAEGKGYFDNLLAKAKQQFPNNRRFQEECDKALNIEANATTPIVPRPPIPPKTRRNLKLLLVICLLGLIWSWLVIGPSVPLAVLSGLGAVWGCLLGIYKQWGWLGGRIDRSFVRVLSHRATFPILVGLLAVGVMGSLLVGTLEVDPGVLEASSVRLAETSDEGSTRLFSTSTLHVFPTTPWAGRELFLHRDGYMPYPITIYPWWKNKVWLEKLTPSPYLVLIPSRPLIEDIIITKPWKVQITVQPGNTTHELSAYYGEPILIGRTNDPPKCLTLDGVVHQASQSRIPSANKSRSHSVPCCKGELEGGTLHLTSISPPIELQPGMTLRVEWKHPTNGIGYCDQVAAPSNSSVGVAVVRTLTNDCR